MCCSMAVLCNLMKRSRLSLDVTRWFVSAAVDMREERLLVCGICMMNGLRVKKMSNSGVKEEEGMVNLKRYHPLNTTSNPLNCT